MTPEERGEHIATMIAAFRRWATTPVGSGLPPDPSQRPAMFATWLQMQVEYVGVDDETLGAVARALLVVLDELGAR